MENFLEWNTFLTTYGDYSPILVARGDVEVAYGLPQQVFEQVWAKLEKQQVSYDQSQATLGRTQVALTRTREELATSQSEYQRIEAELENAAKAYRELKQLLEIEDSEAAQEAEKLLAEGDLDGAIRVMKDRRFALQKIRERMNRELDKEQASTAFILGKAYETKLEYDSALAMYAEAAYFAPHESEYFLYYGNQLYRIAQHDYAIKYLSLALKIDSLDHGSDSLGIYYNNLGGAYKSLGEYARAIDLYEQALAIDTAVYGLNHPDVAIDYSNLGAAYRQLGEYARAIGLYEQALAILKSFLPPDHPYVKTTRQNLSRPANGQGMKLYQRQAWDSAQTYFHLGLRMSLLAEDSSFAVTCLNNLGSSKKHLAAYDSALYYLTWGIELAERLDARMMMGLREQYADSVLSRPEVVQNLEQNYLHTFPLSRLYFHKASTLQRMGRPEEAAPIFHELWEAAIERDDEKLLKEIEAEGYVYEAR